MRSLLVLAAAAALASGGCGGGTPAKVKGRLVSDGQPLSVPASQVAVTFTAQGGGGDKGGPASYTAQVAEDGSFEVVVSGGQMPPGTYKVEIVAVGKLKEKFKGMVGDKSPVRRELKPGPNEVVIDVAKPEG